MNQQLLQRFAEFYGISPTEADVLNLSQSHNYYCRCDACLFWWSRVGADENGKFGPFAAWEIALARAENEQGS